MQLPHQQGSDADVILPSLRAAVFVVDDSQAAGGWGQLHYLLRVVPTGRFDGVDLRPVCHTACIGGSCPVAHVNVDQMLPTCVRCWRVILLQVCATR